VPMFSSIISSNSSSLQRSVHSYTTDLRSHQRYCLPEITIRDIVFRKSHQRLVGFGLFAHSLRWWDSTLNITLSLLPPLPLQAPFHSNHPCTSRTTSNETDVPWFKVDTISSFPPMSFALARMLMSP